MILVAFVFLVYLIFSPVHFLFLYLIHCLTGTWREEWRGELSIIHLFISLYLYFPLLTHCAGVENTRRGGGGGGKWSEERKRSGVEMSAGRKRSDESVVSTVVRVPPLSLLLRPL